MATRKDYRQCFGTPAGRRVLEEMLTQSGFFDVDLSTPGEIAVENFMKKALGNMGMLEDDVVDSFVNKLFEIPVKDRDNG